MLHLSHIKSKILTFVGLPLLLLSLWACKKEDSTILPSNLQLQAGDIVFRQGESFDSKAVLTADRSGCYSHIGIVVDSCGWPMVVHAVPDEPDFEGDADRIKMERPEIFFLRSRAAIGEVMRAKEPHYAQQAARTALHLYRLHLPFDHDYDDSDSSKMYCTELILYAYRKAGIDLSTGTREDIHFPIKFKGYFPSAVHASPHLRSICTF